MGHVNLEVIQVFVHQRFVALDDQKIFRVLFFGCLGEVEAPGNKRLPVDNDYFIVGTLVQNKFLKR
jgi:hypothetical protein